MRLRGMSKSKDGERAKIQYGILSVLLMLFCSASSRADTFFIEGQPGWDQPNKRPYPTAILRLDQGDSSLTRVWSLPEDRKAWSISVYDDPRLVEISVGDWFPEKVYLFPPNHLSAHQVLSLEEYDPVFRCRVWESGDKSPLIQVLHRDSTSPALKEVLYEVESVRLRPVSRSDFAQAEIRLAGAQDVRTGGKSDVAGARLTPGAPIVLIDAGITLDGSPVPDSVMKTNSSRGWTLVANGPRYRALWCVPDSHGPTQRELLTYDRLNDIWKSVMVEGSSTLLRPMGVWLIGVVAETNPDTDFNGGGSVPPVLRDEVALVNMSDGRSFTADLGQDCEILLIDGTTVYFRSGDRLLRGVIDGERIVSQEGLLSVPAVGQIHWGFTGAE